MKVKRLAELSILRLSVALATTFALFLLITGVYPLEATRLIFVLCIQVGTGAFVWSRLRHQHADSIEVLGMGLVLGPILSLASTLAVQVIFGGLWGWPIPAVVSLIIFLITRSPVSPKRTEALHLTRSSITALAVTGVAGVISLIPNIANYPLRWVGIEGNYHPDMLFFESLGTSMAKFGPFDSIFIPGGTIRYHWLIYGWAGELSSTTSASPFVVLSRVVPFLAIAASCLIAIAWVRRLSSVVWAPSLAVLLFIFGGYVGATNGAIFNFDSPSQALSAAWLLGASYALILLLSERVASHARLGVWIGIVTVLFASTIGAKVSAGAVGVAGVCLLALYALIKKPWWWKRAAVSAFCVIVFSTALYLKLVSGSASPGDLKFGTFLDRASTVQGLNPFPGTAGVIVGTLILLIAISLRWAGLLWLIRNATTRTSPSTLYGMALALTGLAAVFFLSSGLNETWFALAASAPLIAISSAGVAEAIRENTQNDRHKLPLLLSAALLAIGGSVVVSAFWITGPSGGDPWVSTLRWLGPLAAILIAVPLSALCVRFRRNSFTRRGAAVALSLLVLVGIAAQGRFLGIGSDKVGVLPLISYEYFGSLLPFVKSQDTVTPEQWSDQHVIAADWLKSHATSEDLIATNISAGSLVPALTGLRTYASSVIYQAMYGPPKFTDVVLQREKEEWGFIDQPSPTTFTPLCLMNANWIWVDPERTQTRNWEPYASVAFENSDALILKINSSKCG
ncbi:MAG: hypothetical protein PHN51_07010 [Candidatus Nanopelagicales bacterium]|nr:hypothetical protein [Candidatus Nanopelagicales bacterium]